MKFLDNPGAALAFLGTAGGGGADGGGGGGTVSSPNVPRPPRRGAGDPGPVWPWDWPVPTGGPDGKPKDADDCPDPTEAEIGTEAALCEPYRGEAERAVVAKCEKEHPGASCTPVCEMAVEFTKSINAEGNCELKTECTSTCNYLYTEPPTKESV